MQTPTFDSVDTKLKAVRQKIKNHEQAIEHLLMNFPEYQEHATALHELKITAVKLRKIRDACRPSDNLIRETLERNFTAETLAILNTEN